MNEWVKHEWMNKMWINERNVSKWTNCEWMKLNINRCDKVGMNKKMSEW